MTITEALRLALPIVCQSGDPLTAQAVAEALRELTGEDKREAARALVAEALAAAPRAPLPAKVFVAHFSSNKHGDAYDVFATREAADHHREQIAIDGWYDFSTSVMPTNRADAAEEYWQRQSERGEDWLTIEGCDVIGAPERDRLIARALRLALMLTGRALVAQVMAPARENPAPAQGNIAAIRGLLEAAEAAGWDVTENAPILQAARDAFAALAGQYPQPREPSPA